MANNSLSELFEDIADSIRDRNGASASTKYKPTQMAAAIQAIETKSDAVYQSKNATPTESAQTITPDTNYDGLSQVNIGAISSTYVGSAITKRSNTDLTANGKTVSVPAGYYAEQTTKDVATATQATPAVTINKTTGVVTGSATQTAGYVAAGTKSGTLNLTTAAGTTITPTKSQQTAVAADRYTLGEIEVAAIPAQYITTADADAQENEVISGKTAYVNGSKITGSLVIQKYYTGTSAPASSLGNNGDIYIQE